LVLEAVVNLLTNPIVLRMAMVFAAGTMAFVIGVVVMRRMRRTLVVESESIDQPASLDSLPLHTYHAVIQQLKQQKHEMQSNQQAERRRSKTSENISGAVLANLSSGVMFIASNGLVRQANTAARQILGFASPVGMGFAEIFRDASTAPGTILTETVQKNLQEQKTLQRLETGYLTPSGEERILEITITAVPSANGTALGVACLINDQTELAKIRRQQALRGEMSAEMALELRKSLTTISDSAKQLATGQEQQSVQRLAADIASEAAHLDHTIGGFLAEPKATGVAART
jgi:PAS domain S-box-containing protein